MIEVEVLATGSKGNCYLLTSGETKILLDCGLAYKKTLKLLDFELPTAVLVTHEHKDHAKSAADFIKHGVDVFMTKGTADALNLEKSHRLQLIEHGENFKIGDFVAYAFFVKHDAAEPVNFAVSDGAEKILYITDTGKIKFNLYETTKLLLETNYTEQELNSSSIEEKQRQRIMENHLSVEKAAEFLKSSDKSKLKEIYLIHISERHGDGEKFQKIIKSEVGDNIEVIVAKNKVVD